MNHQVAIIGAGLVGRKRAAALSGLNGSRLVAVADADPERALALKKDFGGEIEADWQRVLDRDDVDIVVIAAFNRFSMPIAKAAIQKGMHVLCEKPLGRNVEEAAEIISFKNQASAAGNVVLKTGFNLRFHPAIRRAKELIDAGAVGECLNIRARYGHGGRPGMEQEWRASKELCGGGELLDQGVHVIDLIRWFGGEITEVYSVAETRFWDTEVEDNAMAILKTARDATASIHVSWTNWKNIFSFEIHGKDGYLAVNGLGGSYGPETLEFGNRNEDGGRPDLEVFNFTKLDTSWELEWQEFVAAIEEKREPLGNGDDGLKANMVVEAMYKSSAMNGVVRIA